jgi:hypothetical protein
VFKPVDAAVQDDEFDKALALINGDSGKYYAKNDALSEALDKGMLEHCAGESNQATVDFGRADKLIQEAYTKSISQSAASYIANDNTKDYAGEDYENIYLSVFNALSYYQEGKYQDAMVEIRRLTDSASGKLSLLAKKYGEDNTDSRLDQSLSQLSNQDGVSTPSMKFKAPVKFSGSALAHYLAALFYRGYGKADDARIEWNFVPKAIAQAEQEAGQNAGKDANTARLNVLAFSGLSPTKVAANVPVNPLQLSQASNLDKILPAQAAAIKAAVLVTGPLFAILSAIYSPQSGAWGLAYSLFLNPELHVPVLAARSNKVTGVSFSVDGSEPVNLSQIEDMAQVVEETYNDNFGKILIKTAVRTMTKYAAAFVSARAVAEEAGDGAAMLTLFSAIQVANASEIPDLRGCRYIPAKAFVGGLSLSPGLHTVTVRFSDGTTRTFNNIEVKSNQLNLLEAVDLH